MTDYLLSTDDYELLYDCVDDLDKFTRLDHADPSEWTLSGMNMSSLMVTIDMLNSIRGKIEYGER